MLKKLLKIVGVCLLLLCLVMGSLSIFLYTQKDMIQERLLVELNNNLLTKVEVNGKIELSLLSHFPYAALKLEDVVIMGSSGLPNDTLISAMSLYLTSSVFDLLYQNWSIRQIDLRHGWMHMIRNKDGSINYQFVANNKPTDTTTISRPFLLRIEKANLEDIHFIYTDHAADTYIDIQAYELAFSGNFTPEKLALDVTGTAKTNQIQIKETDYAPQQNIQLGGRLELSPKENTYDIKTDVLKIGENNFSIDGNCSILKNGTAFDLIIAGIDLELEDFITLMPDVINNQITGYLPAGHLDFSTSIKGELTNTRSPAINVTFQLVNGRVTHPESDFEINKFAVKGNFNNGAKQLLATSSINIESVLLAANGQQLTGALTVFNLNNPQLGADLKGTIDLSIFKPLIPDSLLQKFSGIVKINSLTYNGPIADLILINHSKPAAIKFDGRFDNIVIGTADISVGLKSGHANLSPWTIQLDTVALTFNQQPIILNGIIKDWKGYLFSLFNDTKEPIKPLNIDLAIRAGDIVIPMDTTVATTASISTTTDSSALIPQHILNIEGQLSIEANSLSYGLVNATNLSTSMHMTPHLWTVHDTKANIFGGGMNISGYVTSNLHFSAIGSVYQIDISQLFESFDNFDQQDLTGDNISGKLKSTFSLTGSYFGGHWNDEVFYLLADIEINDGALVNFAALESLSKFIKIDELRNIQFETLKNQIEIKDKQVHIPQMLIRSSALNLSLSGTHGFDNIVDYSIKLNIYDILANKFRNKNPNNQFYEVVDNNSFNFFISITGPLDNPTIKYDKQGVKDRFKRQGGELRNAIQGIYDEYNTDKERRDWEIPDELEFIDWDETTP